MLGAFAIILALPVVIFGVKQPPAMDEHPEGSSVAAKYSHSSSKTFRSPRFWVLVASVTVAVGGANAFLSNVQPILLDGGLQQSAAEIDRNIRKLGFKTEDVKLIVNSHGHYDHAGGIAALQRASGAARFLILSSRCVADGCVDTTISQGSSATRETLRRNSAIKAG